MAELIVEIDRGSSDSSDFYEMVTLALAHLKKRLQHECEQAYPELRDAVPVILAHEEKRAWDLSSFPHLLLPSLFEARVFDLRMQLNLSREEMEYATLKWSGLDTKSPTAVPAFEIG